MRPQGERRTEIVTLMRRIAKAERRIVRGTHIDEEASRIVRLKDRLNLINKERPHGNVSR